MCHRRCIKLFLGEAYSRMHSVTAILLELGLPSFNTLVHNCRVIYMTQIADSTSDIVLHFKLLGF